MSRSPSKAQSKSPSYSNENEEEENPGRRSLFDEIQREAEEELENAEKFLNAADQVAPETYSPSQRASRVSDSGSRPYSRAGSLNPIEENVGSHCSTPLSRRGTMSYASARSQISSQPRSRTASGQPGSRGISVIASTSDYAPYQSSSAPPPPTIILTEASDDFIEDSIPPQGIIEESVDNDEFMAGAVVTSTPGSRARSTGVRINERSRDYGSRLSTPISARGSRPDRISGARSFGSRPGVVDQNLLYVPGSEQRSGSSGYFSRGESTGSRSRTPGHSSGLRAASRNTEGFYGGKSPRMASQNYQEMPMQQTYISEEALYEPSADLYSTNDSYSPQILDQTYSIPQSSCVGMPSAPPPGTDNVLHGAQQLSYDADYSRPINDMTYEKCPPKALQFSPPSIQYSPFSVQYTPSSIQYSPTPESPVPHHHQHHQQGTEQQKSPEETLKRLCILCSPKNCLPCKKLDEDDGVPVCGAREESTPARKFPTKPNLTPEEVNRLVQCETEDVESAWLLTSDSKKLNKKPCPKQQKAQLKVKNIVQAHGNQPNVCEKEWAPLDDPDPDDISPEVAAAMMFSEEMGIKLEACPKDTINHLFPEDTRTQQIGKKSTVSIVDPNQKDDLIVKSAGVPSDGVSDSAYSRTMKQKGDDLQSRKSDDLSFGYGPEKREYVLVAQKPQRYNSIQFRGNVPNWFPGYFSAYPNQPEKGLRMESSPSKVFQKAWVAAHPENIPKSDIIILD